MDTQYLTPASLLAMAVCFLNITTLTLILRFVVRRLQKLPLGLDDWFIVPAWLLLVATCVSVIAGVAYDRLGVILGDRHDPDHPWTTGPFYPDDRIAQADQFTYAYQVLQPALLAFTKLSVIFFYRRMLCPENLGPFHQLTRAVVVITAIWGVVYTFIYIFQCQTHFSEIFNPTELSLQVCAGGWLNPSFSVTDALLDIVIMVLPIRKIMSLRLPSRKKFAILAAFSVGGLTTAVSIFRCIYSSDISSSFFTFTSSITDEAYVLSIQIYWGLFESGTAVIVACLPSLQYLFRKFLPEQVRKTAQSAEGSGTKSSNSRLKTADALEKASVMTQSTENSRPPSVASAIPVFSSRPGTPAMDVPPPLPEAPAQSFNGFLSRTARLTSQRPSVSDGSVTPVSATGSGAGMGSGSNLKVHKRMNNSVGSFEAMVSPLSRRGSMNSQTLLFEVKQVKMGKWGLVQR